MPQAETGNVRGTDAFHKVAAWDGGDFLFAEASLDCRKTIPAELSSPLLEAAHLQDEKKISKSGKYDEVGANLQIKPLRLACLKHVEMSGAQEGEEEQNEAEVQPSASKKKTNWLLVSVGALLLCSLIFWIFFYGFKK